jgi:hypothetical protein
VTVIGALAVAGDAALRIAEEHEIPLESLARIPSGIWAPADCPLCAQGQPLTSPGESDLDGADRRP